MDVDKPTKLRVKREVVLPPGWRQPSKLARKIAVIATVGVVLGGLAGYWNAYKTVSTTVLAPTGPATVGAPAVGTKVSVGICRDNHQAEMRLVGA